MRAVFALIATCLAASSVSAATIFTGTAEIASDGSRFISLDVNLRAFVPPRSSTQVSLNVQGGTLVSGSVELLNGFDYYAFVDHPPFDDGEDLDISSVCTFGGATNCFSDPSSLSNAFDPTHTQFLSDFGTSPTGIHYTATTFRDFGALAGDLNSCVPAVLNQVCAVRGRFALNTIFARVEGDGPISFTATFSNPTSIPEPGSWAMMIAGLGIAGVMLRRKPSERTAPALAYCRL